MPWWVSSRHAIDCRCLDCLRSQVGVVPGRSTHPSHTAACTNRIRPGLPMGPAARSSKLAEEPRRPRAPVGRAPPCCRAPTFHTVRPPTYPRRARTSLPPRFPLWLPVKCGGVDPSWSRPTPRRWAPDSGRVPQSYSGRSGGGLSGARRARRASRASRASCASRAGRSSLRNDTVRARVRGMPVYYPHIYLYLSYVLFAHTRV